MGKVLDEQSNPKEGWVEVTLEATATNRLTSDSISHKLYCPFNEQYINHTVSILSQNREAGYDVAVDRSFQEITCSVHAEYNDFNWGGPRSWIRARFRMFYGRHWFQPGGVINPNLRKIFDDIDKNAPM